ncbi:Protein MMF1, mitochondrial [Grifola frondosa]|uniref:Protein MMF1, mitochondrial n=1 Tax=Grifola frondosa TaxID=5627 RepID=A0A1C7M425_GRIFR|nr:Protein MMF1, mitochondrial [Grifola frondosa]
MPKQVVFSAEANPPLPIYSQAIISGKTVYVSGSIGCTRDLVLVEGGVQAQTRAALDNMKKILIAAGSGLEHVLKANYFPTNPPARTCIGVAALPLGADVEIECIAELP